MIKPWDPSDASYVIDSHYALYKKERGYDETFRAFIAKKVDEIKTRGSDRERIWIVQEGKKRLGSIAITEESECVARLGLFLLAPEARGKGYGKQLIDSALTFCREVGYEKVTLTTNSDLHTARALYEKFGFAIVHQVKKQYSGYELVDETWERSLLS
ncbi:GNAT family N-acetyltransferase [Halalkalibacterium halodurans]|uniref:BH0478 protein n=1 Tax=Halalkalibacterium halodurans (strain ATCC BAA-125 / DSM 18197 / FERM 7344 / JCM 9153 / C-125) TaxID=272558 RepID=Q9KFK1_HALH5|nr:GNAT family N-acetyltransferase [Halalkalibacterium halodurans]MDY7220976.1 GNAT family N-acetyltransferase [Halalkalibacterium halodurans]MDY7240215.1 GNAT family N-acetyltransferase [Halalkalibacterium halodurans]MED4079867.1 GNAT family N-acetyltransferase [Halalkalibacterium halodurans]MED4085314.1 GNAT family N-acetyltransferase [Halalkalibacterium halodurans]MED4103847.1 GNAT family N-acetyltransferase [Halalkalibacterium halodurans]